ncbi:endonuclease Q family protein [Paenibacillus pinihumi]|uniref:endonuclease Q family protein n=1 Tax=Paenibacillus pinihumi TaxID=669462 RepID=UPI0004010DD9|nr:endonuclease Q family protein [Paenibacillus pinihumi]
MKRREQQTPDLKKVYADLHLHIGRTDSGLPVKISGSRDLTFRNIAHEAAERKGISLIGVIDAHSPGVQQDIAALLDSGEMSELAAGGIRYRNVTLLPGAEIEVRDQGMAGPAHYLCYMPSFDAMQSFTAWMSGYMKNVQLSSQRIYVTGRHLQEETRKRGGLFIPAHIFTPHKSLLGSAATRIGDVLDPELIDAVELGLSADSAMAGWIPDLDRYPFLTNSDAHSLRKIGREYNALHMMEPSFEELKMVLEGRDGRGIAANYGLNPLLGKYHRTYCKACGALANGTAVHGNCPDCGSGKLVGGVMDRIERLALESGREKPSEAARPSYMYQIPLDFMPGLGPKLLDRLLGRFGTEMNILHEVPYELLAGEAGSQLASLICGAREGKVALQSGGGGTYGKVNVIQEEV